MTWAGNAGMFNATDRTSVRSFARHVAQNGTPELAEWLIDNGLIIPHEDQVFRYAREQFGMRQGAWVAYCMAVEIEATGKNDMLANFFLDVIEHIIYGNDTEQEDSVGGFSQRETDLLANHIGYPNAS